MQPIGSMTNISNIVSLEPLFGLSDRVLREINNNRLSIWSAISMRRASIGITNFQGLGVNFEEFGINLQEMIELLQMQRGRNQLSYLNFEIEEDVNEEIFREDIEAMRFRELEVLEALMPILAEDAEIHLEITVGGRGFASIEETLNSFRPYFEGRENRFLNLTIQGSGASQLGGNFGSFVRELKVKECPVLERVDLSTIEKLDFDNCDWLTSVSAPQAHEVFFGDCPRLQEVDTPNVEEATFAGCNALLQVNLPYAEEVRFDTCNSLTQVYLPEVTKAIFDNCPLLDQLDLPSVEEVELINCQSLGVVSLPNAETVAVLDCPNIQLVDLPEDA